MGPPKESCDAGEGERRYLFEMGGIDLVEWGSLVDFKVGGSKDMARAPRELNGKLAMTASFGVAHRFLFLYWMP